MALKKEQKKEIVEKLKGIFSDSETVAFINFHGLGVSDTTDMRRMLREQDVGYSVAKKTLTKLALNVAGAKGEVPELPGELAIVYGAETAPAHEVYEFGKKHEGKLSILGGIFEGKFLNSEEMLKIAQIPSLEVLRGMFVNIINSPIQRCVIALNQIAEKKA